MQLAVDTPLGPFTYECVGWRRFAGSCGGGRSFRFLLRHFRLVGHLSHHAGGGGGGALIWHFTPSSRHEIPEGPRPVIARLSALLMRITRAPSCQNQGSGAKKRNHHARRTNVNVEEFYYGDSLRPDCVFPRQAVGSFS